MIFAIRPMRRSLLSELQLATCISAHKSGSPVETHVLIDAAQDRGLITLFVTNLDEYLQPIENGPKFEYKYLVMPCKAS